MLTKARRKLKNLFDRRNREKSLEGSVDIVKGLSLLTFLSLAIFLAVQLFTNAQLTPLGVKLESLNQEKNALLEDNRELEQEIAQIKSISVTKELTSEKMDLKQQAKNTVVYVTDESLLAGLQ